MTDQGMVTSFTCSRRSSTTASRSGRTTPWPASCSTAPTARSASSASSTCRSTRSAWACGCEAVWAPEERASRRRRRRHAASASAPPSPAGEPTGEPDADRPPPTRSTRSDARRRDRLLRPGAVPRRRRGRDRGADALPGRSPRPSSARACAATRSGSPARAAPTTWPASRSPSWATSRPPAPGRRSRSRHVEMDGAWALYEAGCACSTATSTPPSSSASGISSRGDLREVLCLQNDPYYLMPLWADHISLAALQARALLDTGKARADLAEIAARCRRSALGQPVRPGGRRRDGRRPAGRAVRRRPAAGGRLPAGVRRRGRGGPGRRRPGPRGVRAPGLDPRASTTASSRTTRACATSPTSESTRLAGEARRRGRRADRGGRAVGHLQPRGADPARRPRARRRRRDQPVGRAAGRQPGDGHRAHPHRRGLPADQRARPAPHARPRHLGPVPAAEPRVRPGGRR